MPKCRSQLRTYSASSISCRTRAARSCHVASSGSSSTSECARRLNGAHTVFCLPTVRISEFVIPRTHGSRNQARAVTAIPDVNGELCRNRRAPLSAAERASSEHFCTRLPEPDTVCRRPVLRRSRHLAMDVRAANEWSRDIGRDLRRDRIQRNSIPLQRAAFNSVESGERSAQIEFGLQFGDAGGLQIRLRLKHEAAR